jgi:hypothetical protein
MGFGLDSDAIHSPNEHFGIFNYLKGIETIPLFYKYSSSYRNKSESAVMADFFMAHRQVVRYIFYPLG